MLSLEILEGGVAWDVNWPLFYNNICMDERKLFTFGCMKHNSPSHDVRDFEVSTEINCWDSIYTWKLSS